MRIYQRIGHYLQQVIAVLLKVLVAILFIILVVTVKDGLEPFSKWQYEILDEKFANIEVCKCNESN